MNHSLDISSFLEEFSSFFHSFVFLYFFALVIDEDLLISSCCSLKLCIQFSSFQSLSPLCYCDSMDCSTPGFSVHHQLPELAQTHAVRVSDTIQPSHPLLFPSPLAFNLSSIRVFSKESVLHIRWPKYWSFCFSLSPSDEYSRLISFRIDWLDLLAVSTRDSRVLSNTTVQKHQFSHAQLYLWSSSHIHTWLLEKA